LSWFVIVSVGVVIVVGRCFRACAVGAVRVEGDTRVKKKTILIVWIVGFVIALIGSAMLGSSIYAAAHNCTTTAYGTQNCSLPVTSPLTSVGLIGLVVVLIGAVVGLVAWAGALIRSASMRTWVWFVVVFILGGLGTLIYALAAPADSATPVMAVPQRSYESPI
jgi:hypothetical protein